MRKPWLPPLPEMLAVDSLDAGRSDGRLVPPDPLRAAPTSRASQLQVVESWDLERRRHLMIAGQSRSGRSNSLRVLAGGDRPAVLARGRAPLRHRRRQQRAAAPGGAAPRRRGRDADADRPDVPPGRVPAEGARRAAAVAGRARVRRHRRAAGPRCRRGAAALSRRTPGPVGGLRRGLRVGRRRRAARPDHRAPPGGRRRRHPDGDDRRPQRPRRPDQHPHRGPDRAVDERPGDFSNIGIPSREVPAVDAARVGRSGPASGRARCSGGCSTQTASAPTRCGCSRRSAASRTGTVRRPPALAAPAAHRRPARRISARRGHASSTPSRRAGASCRSASVATAWRSRASTRDDRRQRVHDHRAAPVGKSTALQFIVCQQSTGGAPSSCSCRAARRC